MFDACATGQDDENGSRFPSGRLPSFHAKNNCKGSRSAHTLKEEHTPTELSKAMTTTSQPDVLIDTNEAAQRMGIAPATLHWWRWAASPDQPPAVRVGKRGVRYRASDIAKWIASRETKAKVPQP